MGVHWVPEEGFSHASGLDLTRRLVMARFFFRVRVRVRVDLWPWHSFYLPCYGASCRLQVGADTPVTFNHVI